MTQEQHELEAEASLMQQEGEDLAAMMVTRSALKAAGEGRTIEPSDITGSVGLLLTAAYSLALKAGDDPVEQARLYAGLLRGHLASIEAPDETKH